MLSAGSSAFDGKAAARAAAAWTASAIVLLVIASAVINASDCGEYIMGYACSALSFLSAFAAGAAAAGRGKKGTVYVGALAGAIITTVLLTVGFIVKGAETEASAVLSVVSFTFAGSIAGAVIFGKGTVTRRKRYAPRPRA